VPRSSTRGLLLSASERENLERWVRAPTSPQRVAARSRIILLLADGYSGRQVAATLGISRHTVDLWRRRFHHGGSVLLLRDRPGRGRKRRPRLGTNENGPEVG
jgi:DNA-binding CsgD family transcriptional regulator